METLGGVSAMSHYHSNNHTETSKCTTCTLYSISDESMIQSSCVFVTKLYLYCKECILMMIITILNFMTIEL